MRHHALLLAPLLIAAAPAAAELVPHRAAYAFALAAPAANATITAVDGAMSLAWEDTCDGWLQNSDLQLVLTADTGQEVAIGLVHSTWESKAGDRLTFAFSFTLDGSRLVQLKGEATLPATGDGVAVYRSPPGHRQAVPQGAMFPAAHLLATLERTGAGGRPFTTLIFDGTDPEMLTEVSVIIGAVLAAPVGGQLSSPLLAGPSWPIREAYFPAGDPSGLPFAESEYRLYENGVIDDLIVDYGAVLGDLGGDLRIRAGLTALDALPPSAC